MQKRTLVVLGMLSFFTLAVWAQVFKDHTLIQTKSDMLTVAYLDVGAGGYLDLGSELSEDALQQLPKGRHALVIAGTYGIDGYVAAPQPSYTAQAADSQPAPVRDYPPLPDFETVEQHIYGACRRYITQDMLEPIHNLIRDVIDADRANTGAHHSPTLAPSTPAR